MPASLARPDYALADNLGARAGTVFMTGTQALIRLALMQRQRDAAIGLASQGFISGYRGSPLGMVDQQAWKAAKLLDAAGVKFLPAINEELGATAVLGTQRVESDPERTADGVFAMWYGKGPGVDRAGDALKHGNAYGSSPHGGVLVVAGDDHGCVSSSMPHQSDQTMQSWHMPVLAPANVAEYLEFGLYGWALSRYSGNWVGFTALSEVVESGSTVDLDETNARAAAWKSAAEVDVATGFVRPADGLHYRWPDLPSLKIEQRLHAKLDAVRAFAKINSIDRAIVAAPRATVGIVTCGKAHFDLLEVFRRLDIPLAALADAGVRIYKVGLAYPLEPTRLDAFAEGLDEILVIEEKAGLVEQQLRDQFYNRAVRPSIVGKRDASGKPLVSELGELRPSRLIEIVADWLAARFTQLDRRHLVRDFTVPELLSNASDAVKRVPYFCAGCPHNTSTKVPEGSRAQAGIGCHFMASWMDRDTEGLIQMGGEGVDWVSHAMFTKVPHVFQNLGDGTYYHSGYLAIRQAIAAEDQRHLQDPVQRRGRDDRRPAGRRHDHRRRDRAPGRGRRRDQGRRALRRHFEVRRHPREVPGRHRVPRSRRARRGAASPARDEGRDDPDLRADLCRREAPAQEEGRARRSGAAPLHQRARLRGLRRLLGAVELRRRRSARDRARPEARDRPVELQQGLLVRQGLLPELRRRRRRTPEEAPGRARRAGRGALPEPGRGAAGAGRARLDRALRPARDRRRRHRRRHRRRGDRDGGAPRGPLGERARLHGLRAKGRLGALVRSPGARTRRR